MTNFEQGKFLENKSVVLTFSCGVCGIREATAKKMTPNSVLITDKRLGIENMNEKTYELEMRPFPSNQMELSVYLLRGHAKMFHGTEEASISDLRN
ncbi:MAG: hypothetical protein WCT22_00145 [Patescibacteria group bacterium]